MSPGEHDSRRPALKRGCRLSPDGEVLLIPEGALRLQGPAKQIVTLCDGSKTVAEIANALAAQYSSAPSGKVAADTTAFIDKLAERGAIEFL